MPSAAYAIFTDITGKRQADRELRQSKLHLALAQSISSTGSAAVDFKSGKWDCPDRGPSAFMALTGEFYALRGRP